MIKSYLIGHACPCCVYALANDDTSWCEYYHDQHVDRLCQFGLEPNEDPVIGDTSESVMSFRCVGCGDDCMDYASEVHVLYTSTGEGDE